MNGVQTSIVATQTALGTNIAGSAANLAARLAVSINADGTLNTSGISSLPANSVNTAAIQNLAVTTAKIANLAVTAAQIANATITATQIANGAVGTLQIANNAVGTNQIAAAAITQALLASGAVYPDNLGLTVWNATGSTLTAGQLVYISGWNTANSLAQVSLAVNNTANTGATYIVPASIANAASGLIKRHWTSAANLNTSAASGVGAAVYLDSVAGGWTLTTPVATNQRVQIIGRVIVKDGAVGQVEFDVLSNSSTGISTNDLPSDVPLKDTSNTFTQEQTITAAAAGRCLTLNSDTAATILMNPKSGTQRSNIKWGTSYQFLSDTANNNTGDFAIQNLATGNAVLAGSTTDLITLGSSAAAGGAVLGVSGGKAALYGNAPIVQQAQTTDLKTALVNFGLLGSTAGATPLNLGGGHFADSGGTAPSAAAGANAGGSPPAPVVVGGSNDIRGQITFGTGTAPAAGAMVAVTFATAYSAAPFVLVSPSNAQAASLQICAVSVSTTGFTLSTNDAPAASQANTTYAFNYWVIG